MQASKWKILSHYIDSGHNANVLRIGEAKRNVEMLSVICLKDICIDRLIKKCTCQYVQMH